MAAALAALVGGIYLALSPIPPLPRHAEMRVITVPPAAPARVLTERDLARMANDAALAHLHSLDGGKAIEKVLAARTAVARFRVEARSKDGPDRLRKSGCGVLVNGGRHLLVAGHVLDILEGFVDPEYRIVTAEGDTIRGKVPAVRGGVDGAPDGDWGLVELEGSPPEGCASLRMAAVEPGATVVLLAYSGGHGLHPDGQVYWTDGFDEAPLTPLSFVGTADESGSVKCRLVAGARTAGGASGGAIVDLGGNLVGVMVTSHHDLSTGHAFKRRPVSELEPRSRIKVDETMWFEGTPVGVFREWIERRWQR
ncbi:MAG TPA: serine protease [Planctomycetota bacterium]|nr:serine protease [Planctomycetota bacterium]